MGREDRPGAYETRQENQETTAAGWRREGPEEQPRREREGRDDRPKGPVGQGGNARVGGGGKTTRQRQGKEQPELMVPRGKEGGRGKGQRETSGTASRASRGKRGRQSTENHQESEAKNKKRKRRQDGSPEKDGEKMALKTSMEADKRKEWGGSSREIRRAG